VGRITPAVRSGNAYRPPLKILPGVQITLPSGPPRFSEALGFGGPRPALAPGFAAPDLHSEESDPSLFYALRSNDIIWTRRLQSLVAGMADEYRYAAWPDLLLVSPATKHPGDRI
jgi:hypothetical protein